MRLRIGRYPLVDGLIVEQPLENESNLIGANLVFTVQHQFTAAGARCCCRRARRCRCAVRCRRRRRCRCGRGSCVTIAGGLLVHNVDGRHFQVGDANRLTDCAAAAKLDTKIIEMSECKMAKTERVQNICMWQHHPNPRSCLLCSFTVLEIRKPNPKCVHHSNQLQTGVALARPLVCLCGN